MSNTASAIVPSDFSERVTDPNRNLWTVGTMQYAVRAAQGHRVTLVTDTRTGFTVHNVRLVKAYYGGPGSGPRIRVSYEYESGKWQETNYYLPGCGIVIVHPNESGDTSGYGKYPALEMHRRDISSATAKARAEVPAGKAGEWGSWKATAIDNGTFDVTYEPHTGNPHFADQWGERYYVRVRVTD